MRKYRKAMAIVFSFFLAFCAVANVRAEEFVSKKKGLDVIFVMDYSGSMKKNDPDFMAKGMVQAFIDTVHSTDIRIGFVAYNDKILAAASPTSVYTDAERQVLKELIDKTNYSGNTDIGLGLRYAYELIGQEEEREAAIVLISDGESDLAGSTTGRQLEDALLDMEYVASRCGDEGIPIYSVAFGKYGGDAEILEQMSYRTNGQMYSVQKPETLIEVLYGILADTRNYSIERIADGIYASGKQEILVKLDEPYVDELDVLLISPQTIGTVEISYGGQQIEGVNLRNYAAAKITDVDAQVKELIVQTETIKSQELQVYLIAYRALIPVLNVNTSAAKNRLLEFQVYFKDCNGNVISDEQFYKNFIYEFTLYKEGEADKLAVSAEIQERMIRGEFIPEGSGVYFLEGNMTDHMGNITFMTVEILVQNRHPVGDLPENIKYTVLTREQRFTLDDFFSDPDGDEIQYVLKEYDVTCVRAEILDGELRVDPIKPGRQTIKLLISDGEETCEYLYNLEVVHLWQAYWWVFVPLVIATALLLWKIFHKPKPELERLTEEKKQNHFSGKLDAYFLLQPEEEEEIPPLSFQMNEVKDGRVSLGSLFGAYPKQAEALHLEDIFLIADENRSMILYHRSQSGVMIGNAFACVQIQYSVSFGDIIYITSPEGDYDLEIHYVALFQ